MADEEFFKKIYGYYYCDKGFAGRVAKRLLQLGRKDTIREYNQWLAGYQEQENEMLKEVAQWQIEQVNDWYEREVKKWIKKSYSKNSETQMLRLLKKKQEILEEILLQTTK